ncbi:hypothetical protein Hanom_Chr03g00243071 [Helianthus anomalus]
MDGVNEPDENDKISNLLNPDAEKQIFGQTSQTGQTSGTKMAFYSPFFTLTHFTCYPTHMTPSPPLQQTNEKSDPI